MMNHKTKYVDGPFVPVDFGPHAICHFCGDRGYYFAAKQNWYVQENHIFHTDNVVHDEFHVSHYRYPKTNHDADIREFENDIHDPMSEYRDWEIRVNSLKTNKITGKYLDSSAMTSVFFQCVNHKCYEVRWFLKSIYKKGFNSISKKEIVFPDLHPIVGKAINLGISKIRRRSEKSFRGSNKQNSFIVGLCDLIDLEARVASKLEPGNYRRWRSMACVEYYTRNGAKRRRKKSHPRHWTRRYYYNNVDSLFKFETEEIKDSYREEIWLEAAGNFTPVWFIKDYKFHENSEQKWECFFDGYIPGKVCKINKQENEK
jgi:hypothetical protein